MSAERTVHQLARAAHILAQSRVETQLKTLDELASSLRNESTSPDLDYEALTILRTNFIQDVKSFVSLFVDSSRTAMQAMTYEQRSAFMNSIRTELKNIEQTTSPRQTGYNVPDTESYLSNEIVLGLKALLPESTIGTFTEPTGRFAKNGWS